MWKREKSPKWQAKQKKTLAFRQMLQKKIRKLWRAAKPDTLTLLTRVMKESLKVGEDDGIGAVKGRWSKFLVDWGKKLQRQKVADIKKAERDALLPAAMRKMSSPKFQSEIEIEKRFHQRDEDSLGLPYITHKQRRKANMWGCIKCHNDVDGQEKHVPVPKFDETYKNTELARHFFIEFDRVETHDDAKWLIDRMDGIMRSEYVQTKLSPVEKAAIVKAKLLQTELELSHYQSQRVQILPGQKVPAEKPLNVKWPNTKFKVLPQSKAEKIRYQVPPIAAMSQWGNAPPVDPGMINQASKVADEAMQVYIKSHEEGAPLDSDK